MARNTTHKITKPEFDKWIKNNQKSEKIGQEIPLGGTPGFHARQNKNGISLRVRYKNNFNQKKIKTIGLYSPQHNITLNKGHELAQKFYSDLISGVLEHPIQQTKNLQNTTLQDYLENTYWRLHLQYLESGRTVKRTFYKHFPMFLNLPLSQINKHQIPSWKDYMIAKELSAQTIESFFKNLKALLNHAVENEFLTSNPIKSVKLGQIKAKKVKSVKRVKKEVKRRPLTKEEIQAIFEGIQRYQTEKIEQRLSSIKHGKKYLEDISKLHYADYVAPMIYVLFYTGMRPGDVYSLEWEHIDFNNELITKTINKTSYMLEPPTVTVSMNPDLKEALLKWHQQNGEPTKGLCFVNSQTGNKLSKWALNKPWKKIKKLGGLKADLDLYALRHNFISQLLMNNTGIFIVCRLVGHQSPDMIMKHYGHLNPEIAQETVNKLPSLIQ